jgi:hypothetical protein
MNRSEELAKLLGIEPKAEGLSGCVWDVGAWVLFGVEQFWGCRNSEGVVKMIYMGSKNRIAKDILEIMLKDIILLNILLVIWA